MFKNYIKIAYRNLLHNKLFSILNISGLSIGIAVSILLISFIYQELHFDNYKNTKDIYRIIVPTYNKENLGTLTNAPNMVAPTIKKEIPEVKDAIRILKNDFGAPTTLVKDNKAFIEKNLYWADPAIVDFFDFNITNGNTKELFLRPHSIIISESEAKKLFGNENPIGKTINGIESKQPLTITGVFQDFKDNSTFDFSIIGNIVDIWAAKPGNLSWSNSSFETYCILYPNVSPEIVNHKLQTIIDKNIQKNDQWYKLILQPLSKVHLYSNEYQDGYSSKIGDIKEVRNLAILAVIIAFLACINYANLSTAQSQKKAMEVGINRTFGAKKSQIFSRIYIETGLVTSISFCLGILLACLSLPFFEELVGRKIELIHLFNVEFIVSILSLWIVITIISGIYPAILLTKVNPITILKKGNIQVTTFSFLRKILVIVQYTISTSLIIAIIFIYAQLNFIKHKDIGYNTNGNIAISLSSVDNENKYNQIVQNIKNIPSVQNAILAQSYPTSATSGRSVYKSLEDKSGMEVSSNYVSNNIVSTLGLTLITGSDLYQNLSKKDSTVQIIVNQKVCSYLGYTPNTIIGKSISIMGIEKTKTIVKGVVKDFNFESLHAPIGGYIFYSGIGGQEPYRYILVRFNTNDISNSINEIKKAFLLDNTSALFDYTFLNTSIENLYKNEKNLFNTILASSILAIFIACLGLYGIASYTSESRQKEIGIRKVLGASVLNITTLLSTSFLQLVIVAIIIAIPITAIFLKNWLNGFAYRISLNWLYFGISAMVILLISVLTISIQTIKTAIANPVKSLRSE